MNEVNKHVYNTWEIITPSISSLISLSLRSMWHHQFCRKLVLKNVKYKPYGSRCTNRNQRKQNYTTETQHSWQIQKDWETQTTGLTCV